MKAIVTIHQINLLDAVRLGDLTQEVFTRFSVYPSVTGDTMVFTTTVADHLALLRQVEDLTVTLALKFHPDLWTSTSNEEASS